MILTPQTKATSCIGPVMSFNHMMVIVLQTAMTDIIDQDQRVKNNRNAEASTLDVIK